MKGMLSMGSKGACILGFPVTFALDVEDAFDRLVPAKRSRSLQKYSSPRQDRHNPRRVLQEQIQPRMSGAVRPEFVVMVLVWRIVLRMSLARNHCLVVRDIAKTSGS